MIPNAERCQFIRLAHDDDGHQVIGNYPYAGEWPPPELVETPLGQFRRISYSAISDEDAIEMTHVARGALYSPVEQVPE